MHPADHVTDLVTVDDDDYDSDSDENEWDYFSTQMMNVSLTSIK